MIRGFQPVNEDMRKVTQDFALPVRGDSRSAGYDISIPVSVIIPPKGKALVWTNIKAYMQSDEVLELYVRSSIGIKKGLQLSNTVGIIDSSYYSNPDNDGNIGISFYNTTDQEVILDAGERVAQGIFKKYLVADNDVCLNESRSGGIGSTGK
ncbi:MAG: dUTP diphosphatase [Peptostreptococcaceae bacterium]